MHKKHIRHRFSDSHNCEYLRGYGKGYLECKQNDSGRGFPDPLLSVMSHLCRSIVPSV